MKLSLAILGLFFLACEAETGDMGDPGETGLQGEVGAQGARGEPGEMGPVGPQGEDGIPGPQGPQGPQGVQGERGPEGPIGATGERGPEGPMGPQGPQGMTGLPGERGPQGPAGPEGLRGEQGPIGLDGLDGEQGPMGPEGPVGPQGPQGPQGVPGPIGPQGDPGAFDDCDPNETVLYGEFTINNSRDLKVALCYESIQRLVIRAPLDEINLYGLRHIHTLVIPDGEFGPYIVKLPGTEVRRIIISSRHVYDVWGVRADTVGEFRYTNSTRGACLNRASLSLGELQSYLRTRLSPEMYTSDCPLN